MQVKPPARISDPGQETVADLGVHDFASNTWQHVGYVLVRPGRITLCLTNGAMQGSLSPEIPVSILLRTPAVVAKTVYGDDSLSGIQVLGGWLIPNGAGVNSSAVVRVARAADNRLLVGINAAIAQASVTVVHIS